MQRLVITIAVLGFAIPLAAHAADTRDSRAAKDAAEHRETEALNRLEAAGYHDFRDVTPAGSGYHATVMKGGQEITVLVEPGAGRITPVR